MNADWAQYLFLCDCGCGSTCCDTESRERMVKIIGRKRTRNRQYSPGEINIEPRTVRYDIANAVLRSGPCVKLTDNKERMFPRISAKFELHIDKCTQTQRRWQLKWRKQKRERKMEEMNEDRWNARRMKTTLRESRLSHDPRVTGWWWESLRIIARVFHDNWKKKEITTRVREFGTARKWSRVPRTKKKVWSD